VHLRDAEALADLALGHVLAVAHAQHLPVARLQAAQQRREDRAVLGALEAVVVAAEQVAEDERVVVA
jgi:hypothetical protein